MAIITRLKGIAPKRGTLIATALVAAAASFAPASPFIGEAAAQSSTVLPSEEIVLSIGRGQLVRLPAAMTDLFVADNSVADVQVQSSRQLYVFGRAGGETTLYASNAAGNIVYAATIRVGSNIDTVDQMLALAMPNASINVNTMNGIILLTGTIATPQDGAEAERLVEAFVGGDTRVVSRLRTATPLQVNLQVRIAEVSRSLVRAIGSNLLTQDSSSGFRFGVGRTSRSFAEFGEAGLTSGQIANLPVLDASGTFGLPAGSINLPFNPATGQFVTTQGTPITFNVPTDGTTALAAAGRLFGLDVAGAFDLSEQLGLVTTLSQPNLTALSGETADFLAGGEFPVPIPQGLGATAVEYRRFGVSLAYTPTVLANGRISLRVRPEVSELSSSGAVTLQGFNIPGLTIRRAETTIELGSGQSFMIAGLLSTNSQNSLNQAPGLGDIPILGNLFRSNTFQRGETELVIVVTPYLVEPVNPNEIVLPTDGFRNATEAQRMFLNRENDGDGSEPRPGPTIAPAPSQGPSIGALPDQSQGPIQAPPAVAAPAPQSARNDGSTAPGFSFD